MTNAYHRLSLAERRLVREANRRNLLYMILYQPLWHQRGGDLSPEDVWAEALLVARELQGVNAFEARMKAAATVEDLCERYSVFEDEQGLLERRDENQAMHSTMMVVTVAFFMLLNEEEELDDHPNRYICKALKDAVRGVEGFIGIYEGARREEDALEYSGKFIEACSLLEYISGLSSVSERDISRLHEVMGVLVDETKKCNLPTIEEQERLFARVNDKTDGAIDKELNELRVFRDQIKKNNNEPPTLDLERLGVAVEEVQAGFWAQSSWGVVFCVCRDLYGGITNASQFERDVQALEKTHHFNHKCPNGTVSRTISNNSYMVKHIDKWAGANAPKRAMSLAAALKASLENSN